MIGKAQHIKVVGAWNTPNHAYSAPIKPHEVASSIHCMTACSRQSFLFKVRPNNTIDLAFSIYLRLSTLFPHLRPIMLSALLLLYSSIPSARMKL